LCQQRENHFLRHNVMRKGKKLCEL
jgi:hypothetical protein